MSWTRAAVVSAAIGLSAGLVTKARAADATAIGEIVVTAERRSQDLQDVALAVTAFTADRRRVQGLTTIQDMVQATPGLQYSTQLDRVSLRGVGRTTNVHTADASVAVYSDGIYSPTTIEAAKSPLFLDRVEVLRGPQSTLYGTMTAASSKARCPVRP